MPPQLATQVKYVLPVLHERCSAIFRPAKAPKVASDQLQEQRKGWAQVWYYICEIEQ